MLISQRKHFFVVAGANIYEEVVCDLTGPQGLQNVCGFDLKPAGLRSYELKGSVAAEEAVLLVVKPDEAELVPLVQLPIAAQGGVGLVINIGGRIASLITNRENTPANIVAAVGSEQPPSIFDHRSA